MSRVHLRQGLFRLALLIASLVGPRLATAQQLQMPPKAPYPPGGIEAPLGRNSRREASLRLPPMLLVAGEVEPNNFAATATLAALGDTVSGVIDPEGDVDYIAFDLNAGTHLLLEVDANEYGSPLDPILFFLDTDGQTVLTFDDDSHGLDSRIYFTVPASGRYYAAIADWSNSGSPNYFYWLRIGTFTPGPGDPTTPWVQGFSAPTGIAATTDGGFLVADWDASEVLRVSPSGTVSNFAAVGTPYDLAFDSYGNLLVATGDSGVYRITPSGARSRFLGGFLATAVAIDAGGDVWIGGFDLNYNPQVRRFDAGGALKRTIEVPSMGSVNDLAFSPSGDLFGSGGYSAVFRITESGSQALISSLNYPEGLAFDRDGYLYVANGLPGEIHLYDPALNEVGTFFARDNLSGPIQLAFGRDASGVTTSRLFATNAGYANPTDFPGSILEVNSTGVRAPGFAVGFTRPAMDLESVADAVLGDPAAITPDQADFLDRQGNGNGRLDVADFRVFLRLLNATARMAGRAAP
jgi:sugar lactone lactonase YvrE